MSAEDLDRVAVLQRVLERRITRVKAAELLGISERQARRLTKAFELHGPAALADKRRGAPSNRKLSSELRDHALALIRDRYYDFGPTLARESAGQVETQGACHRGAGNETGTIAPSEKRRSRGCGRR